eukprot:358495-Chlamydomonas_euryale.AAC.4
MCMRKSPASLQKIVPAAATGHASGATHLAAALLAPTSRSGLPGVSKRVNSGALLSASSLRRASPSSVGAEIAHPVTAVEHESAHGRHAVMGRRPAVGPTPCTGPRLSESKALPARQAARRAYPPIASTEPRRAVASLQRAADSARAAPVARAGRRRGRECRAQMLTANCEQSTSRPEESSRVPRARELARRAATADGRASTPPAVAGLKREYALAYINVDKRGQVRYFQVARLSCGI